MATVDIEECIHGLFPNVNMMYESENSLYIELEDGSHITFQSLQVLADLIGTRQLHVEKRFGVDDETLTPEMPCRIVCDFFGPSMVLGSDLPFVKGSLLA